MVRKVTEQENVDMDRVSSSTGNSSSGASSKEEEVKQQKEKDSVQMEGIEESEETEEKEAGEPAEEAKPEPDKKNVITNMEEGDDKKKGFFKKKEKKDKAQEQIDELNDKVKRQMAEFENFRKRTEKEKSQMYEIGAKSIIEKILPVVDNFERGLQAVPEDGSEDAFVQGMDKIYKQLMTELDNMGVKVIDTIGQEFNPEFHNAVMQVENEEYESGFIAQELLKGYTYRESVVRHSMVAVVQ